MDMARWRWLRFPIIAFVSKIPLVLLLRYTGFLDVYVWETRGSEFVWTPDARSLAANVAAVRSGAAVPMPPEFARVYRPVFRPSRDCVHSDRTDPSLVRLFLSSDAADAVGRHRLRASLRNLSALVHPRGIRLTFLVNLAHETQEASIRTESSNADDLLVGAWAEGETSRGWLMALDSLATRCRPFAAVLLGPADADLRPFLAALPGANLSSPLILGNVAQERPQRFRWRSDYVSLSEFRFSRFPPHVASASPVLLSYDAALDVYYASYFTSSFRLFHFYLGILAKCLGYPITPLIR